MKINTAIVALVLGFALTLPAILPACASFTAVGVMYQADVTPGQHIENEIKLSIGTKDHPIDLTADILGLNQTLDGGYTMIKADQDHGLNTARPFLNVSPSQFHLDPGDSKKVLISGDVPLGIGDGSRYAMASIRGSSKGNGSIGVALVLNVPILLTISGSQLSKTAEIIELDASKPIYNNQKNATLTLKNTGNTHFRAIVKAVLKDNKGNVIANSTTIQPTLPPILPEKLRKFVLSLKSNRTIDPGNYALNVTACLEDGTVLAGKETMFDVGK
jgi:hypothetical protein